MHPTPRRSRFDPAGFSLIELMVGMALGLLSVLIITQVMSLFEAQRRSTTGSADAQTNGGIALYSISRELQMAGFGLMPITNPSLECNVVTYGGTGITGIAPVSITDGVAAAGVDASDTITLRYATSQMGGTVSQVSSLVGNAATVQSNLGCQVGDATLASAGATCAFSTVTAVSAAGVSPITITLANTTNVLSSNLGCLGQWNEVTYAVNQATGNLDRTSVVNGVSTTVPSVVGVVNLQAQYGISTSATSNQIVQWVDATAGGTWDPALITVANRNRIKAVRVAVVARNAKIEPAAVTTACSSIVLAAPTGLCAWDATSALPNPIALPFIASPAPTIDLSPADANWARYRYRVFETIIPLRNVIWAKGTL
ncbi:MAG TPA: PilW family protein [Burkholderiales bacterium]|nr:PilW family protein [Burkholderiales bacterium]